MNRMNRRVVLSFAVSAVFGLVASFPTVARGAADGFAPLPAERGAKRNGLLMRIVGYEGSTNGAITVEVKNPKTTPEEFTAKGVYFVPQGNANEAPQRLGAVGPFQVSTASGPQRLERLVIAAGATERLTLDVYCIDSHRASPSSSTGFRVAKDRVPKQLTQAIAADAAKSTQGLGGVSAAAAKPAVQSEVWKNRDKRWIELDGEGPQEAGKHR